MVFILAILRLSSTFNRDALWDHAFLSGVGVKNQPNVLTDSNKKITNSMRKGSTIVKSGDVLNGWSQSKIEFWEYVCD